MLSVTPRTSQSASIHHYVLGSALVLVGVVACLVCFLPLTRWSQTAPSGALGAETTGLFDTERFRSLMTAHVRNLMVDMNVDDDHVQKHVDDSLASAAQYIGNHASSSEENSLRNVRLGPEGWETVRALLFALSDKRVQDVGHAVVQEARANLLAGPAEIGKRVVARLRKEHLLSVAQELLPTKLRSTLIQRWDAANAQEDDIWKMLLDPTGEKFAKIRENTTSSTIESSALLASPSVRSLRDGPWGGPFKLNWAERTIGITAVVWTTAAEIMLHIDFFLSNFDPPRWVQGMLIVPAISGGSLSCAIGKSFYCQYCLGALGLNALDAIAIAAGLNLDTDSFGVSEDLAEDTEIDYTGDETVNPILR